MTAVDPTDVDVGTLGTANPLAVLATHIRPEIGLRQHVKDMAFGLAHQRGGSPRWPHQRVAQIRFRSYVGIESKGGYAVVARPTKQRDFEASPVFCCSTEHRTTRPVTDAPADARQPAHRSWVAAMGTPAAASAGTSSSRHGCQPIDRWTSPHSHS
jgi:hypothetical protein